MELQRGDQTRIVSGSFKDLKARVIEIIPDQDLVRVELKLLNRKVRVELSPLVLEAPAMDPLPYFRKLLLQDHLLLRRFRLRHWWKQHIYSRHQPDLERLYEDFCAFRDRVTRQYDDQLAHIQSEFEKEFQAIDNWNDRRSKWLLEEKRWLPFGFKETVRVRDLTELEDINRQDRLHAELFFMARDEKNRLAESLWEEAEYSLWKKKRFPPIYKLKEDWEEREAQVQKRYPQLKQQFKEQLGLYMPRHLLTFYAFYSSLAQKQRDFLLETPFFQPVGIFAWLDPRLSSDSGPKDPRLWMRDYRDPPEFLPLILSGNKGGRLGFWYDTPDNKPNEVKFVEPGSPGLFSRGSTTLLEELRHQLREEIAQSDWYQDPERYFVLRSLVDTAQAFEPAELSLRKASLRLATRTATLDHCGVWVDGWEEQPSRDLIRIKNLILNNSPKIKTWLDEAEEALSLGNPVPMLALGRDFHWLSKGNPQREKLAADLLQRAYRACGREVFADWIILHQKLRSKKVSPSAFPS